MATEEQLIAALNEADAAGNRDDAKKLARALQASRKVATVSTESDQPEQSYPVNFMNRGMADTLGAPVDLIAAGLNKATNGFVPVDSFGGSKSIRRGLDAIGIRTPERDPETVGENVGAVMGEVAGFMVPMAALSRRYQNAKGVGGALAKAANDQLVKKPVQSGVIEAGGAAGAGVGRYIADLNEFGEGGQLAAEVVGGLGGGFMATGGISRRLLDFTKWGGAKLLFPFTEIGGEVRASRRLRELAMDPEAAAKSIEDLKGTNLLPSARTQEPGLMALEQAILGREPALAARASEAAEEGMARLVAEIKRSGSVRTVRSFVEAKRSRLFAALDARIEQAGSRAAQAVEDLAEDSTQAEISGVLREQLDSALADAKIQENMLWAAVPQETMVPVQATRRAYQDALGGLSAAQAEDMPPIARQIVEGMKEDSTRLMELDGFYKKLGEVSRQARMDGERNKSRLAETLRAAILEDIGKAKGSEDVREALKTARAFSLQVANRFRQGPVGRLLGTDKVGADRIPAELALERTVGRAGTSGRLGLDALQDAIGPRALEPVQAYLKRRFTDEAVIDGAVDLARSQTFLRRHADVLGSFPHLRDQFAAARQAEDVSRRVKKSSDGYRRAFQNPAVSATARFLGAPVDQEIKRILGAHDPSRTMAELVKVARKDRSGKVLEGLKSGLAEYMVKFSSSGVFDSSGRNPLSGHALLRMLDSEVVGQVAREVFDPQELRQIRRNAEMIAVINKRQAHKASLPEVLEDRPAWLVQTIGRVIGAKFGAAVAQGGASIQAAQMGSSNAKKFLERLTSGKAERILTEAIVDGDLMKHLLIDVDKVTPQKWERAEKYLRAWSLSRGLGLFDEEE